MAATTLLGTTGNDILNAPGSISAQVDGFQGADTITLALVNDTAQAGKGHDKITVGVAGLATNDIQGGQGDDTLIIGTGVTIVNTTTYGGDGADLLQVSANLGANNAFFAGNAGNDTIVLNGAATLAQVQAGQGNDSIHFNQGGTSTTVAGGKGADTLTFAAVAPASFNVNTNNGHDVLRLSAVDSATFTAGGGQGTDSIWLSTGSVSQIAGGGLADTITYIGGTALAAATIYGDGAGVKAKGTGTGGAADGNDLITGTAQQASALTVYGAGGADTINFLNLLGSGVVLDGGNGHDLIGSSAMAATAILTNATTSLVGGAGNDTIAFAGLTNSANNFIALGGDGNDSIAAFGTGLGSINGGAGSDIINYTVPGALSVGASGQVTINGGDGNDTILLGNFSAGLFSGTVASVTTLTANAGNVVYASGDKIQLSGIAQATGANWIIATQIYVMSGASAGLTADTMSQVGSVAVWKASDDLVIAISADTAATCAYQLINVIGGGAQMKVTGFGASAINSSNFGFTISTMTSVNGISIDFT